MSIANAPIPRQLIDRLVRTRRRIQLRRRVEALVLMQLCALRRTGAAFHLRRTAAVAAMGTRDLVIAIRLVGRLGRRLEELRRRRRRAVQLACRRRVSHPASCRPRFPPLDAPPDQKPRDRNDGKAQDQADDHARYRAWRQAPAAAAGGVGRGRRGARGRTRHVCHRRRAIIAGCRRATVGRPRHCRRYQSRGREWQRRSGRLGAAERRECYFEVRHADLFKGVLEGAPADAGLTRSFRAFLTEGQEFMSR